MRTVIWLAAFLVGGMALARPQVVQRTAKQLIGKQLVGRMALTQDIHKSPGGQEIGNKPIEKRLIDRQTLGQPIKLLQNVAHGLQAGIWQKITGAYPTKTNLKQKLVNVGVSVFILSSTCLLQSCGLAVLAGGAQLAHEINSRTGSSTNSFTHPAQSNGMEFYGKEIVYESSDYSILFAKVTAVRGFGLIVASPLVKDTWLPSDEIIEDDWVLGLVDPDHELLNKKGRIFPNHIVGLMGYSLLNTDPKYFREREVKAYDGYYQAVTDTDYGLFRITQVLLADGGLLDVVDDKYGQYYYKIVKNAWDIEFSENNATKERTVQ